MDHSPVIVPAIIPDSIEQIEDALSRVGQFTDTIQIDIVDGKFVPFTSWPYKGGGNIGDLRAYAHAYSIEIDLMVESPEDVITEYVMAGAKRIVVHLESTEMPEYILEHRRKYPYLLGFSIVNDTPLSELTKYREDIDFVQLMGIADIGSQGQPFDHRVLERIRTLREWYPELPISIDGSVNRETLPLLWDAGATRFVSGSAILHAKDPREAFEELALLAR